MENIVFSSSAILVIVLLSVAEWCNGAPRTLEIAQHMVPLDFQLPAYVIKFVSLFPNGAGRLPHCDHNTTPRSRNPCDFRLHFDVLFPDDSYKIPYADMKYVLPDNRDYFVAESSERYPGLGRHMPSRSYPGAYKSISGSDYERILRDDASNRPIVLRITVFDRDDVGSDDMVAQESFEYYLDDAIRLRETIQTKYVRCLPEAKCSSIMLKFMFYMLDKEE